MQCSNAGAGQPSIGGTSLTTSGSLVDQKYRLEERLGEGAAGIVYRAVHVGLEKSFAIKLLKTARLPVSAALKSFRRVAVALGRLRHPNIVDLTDFGIDMAAGGVPYVVTEFLEGKPLSDVCRDQGPLPFAQALPLLRQIAAAVDAAHDVGVLHRSLKPGNVFVCSTSPESPSVKVLDFGLAELLAGQDKDGEENPPVMTTTGSLSGTPMYLAPELIRLEQASRSSDIYSYGVLAYEILGGKPPLRGTLEEALAGPWESEPPPPLPMPPQYWGALWQTLRKDPTLRPDTAGEVVRQLKEEVLEAARLCWRHSIPSLNREPSDDRIEQQLAQRDRLAAEYDEVHAELRRPRKDSGIWNALQDRLRDLESGIEAILRSFFPSLGWKEARASLTHGTALLAYHVGASQSLLFVLEPQWVPGMGLSLYPIAIGREELKREVEAFRNMWGRPDADLSALKERGQQLYDLLVRPAEPVLGKAARWLISPDGSLHFLPFATLFSGTHYLADSKPIHIHISTEKRMENPKEGQSLQWMGLSRPYYAQLTGDCDWTPQPRSRRTPHTLPELTPSFPIKAGRLVGGKYRLEERRGEGAIGVVHRAVHVGLDRSFAVKLLKTTGAPAPAALERFRREAVALGRLRHPHIVAVTDFGIDGSEGGLSYIVTELLKGTPLSDVCRDQGPLPLGQAFSLLGQIAAAIDAAHDAGVLHRDLKPGNVFLCSEGPGSPNVKVLDFGLAELLAGPDNAGSGRLPDGANLPAITTTGALLGTPLYVAPELIRLGQASRSSDIYSFGVLAYEIFGGKPPFRGTSEEVLACHLEVDPPPLPLPPEFWRPLRETLQKNPALRPGTAGEVVRRLREGVLEAERACWRSIEVPRSRSEPVWLRQRDQLAKSDRRFVHQLPRDLYAELLRLAAEYAQERPELHRKQVSEIQNALLRRRYDLKSRIRALEVWTETRADLAPGTALLTYYVGEWQSFLFVIGADGVPDVELLLYPLAIGKEELKKEIEAFRNASDLSALKERGRHLYDLLVRPAEPVLVKADRWLISPDGPLHSLPFATLFSGTQYLADFKPIYLAAFRYPPQT